ncbi:MAG: hypothetical protein H7Y42_15820 [Chitinophagaceae bacterium]|nr:hypothetical protein [Chitinophagaceae bacterium]
MKHMLVCFFITGLVACNKEVGDTPSFPKMRYSELNDVRIGFGQQKMIDIDGDNSTDLLFTTVLVGDPVLKRDRKQYYVNASFDTFLLTDAIEQTPIFKIGEVIPIGNPPGLNWFNASSVVLVEKIIELDDPAHWEGNWKNATHRYLAVQLRKDNKRYNGWVEISVEIDLGQMVLHRAAISEEPGRSVRAGH